MNIFPVQVLQVYRMLLEIVHHNDLEYLSHHHSKGVS